MRDTSIVKLLNASESLRRKSLVTLKIITQVEMLVKYIRGMNPRLHMNISPISIMKLKGCRNEGILRSEKTKEPSC